MTFRVDWIEDERGLVELAPAWEALAEQAGLPFARHGWFLAWWQAFGRGSRLSTCALWDGDELVGVLPLRRVRRRLETLTNEHTPVFVPLARDADALGQLAHRAVEAVGGELLVSRLPADHEGVRVFAEAAAGRGIVWIEPRASSPIVELGGTVEELRARIGAKERRELERRRRRLAEDHDVRMRLLEASADIDGELDAGFRVEASGWKGKRGTAIVSDPAVELFYRLVARSFHAAGRFAPSALVVDGDLAAFNFCLIDHRRAWSMKIGYDERYGRFAPGLMLRYAQLEHAYELGLEGYEMLGDADRFKMRFANRTRDLVDVRLFRRQPVPVARYLYRRYARPTLRALHRRVRSRG